MTFRDALEKAYGERPCQVLPNALWKTRSRLNELEKDFMIQDEQVCRLAIWGARELLAFWSRGRVAMDFPFDRFAHADLLLLHQDYISNVDLTAFKDRKRYFRLRYSGAHMPPVPAGWRVRDAVPAVETEAIAEVIRQCYPGSTMSPKVIQQWENYPVHDPSLWIWVEDSGGHPMGLGIAEFDSQIREGSLEWIQVLPDYRRRGVGQVLVSTLVRRLRPQSVLITVSGELESRSRPDMLYRKCGFIGDDVWWVLRRDVISS